MKKLTDILESFITEHFVNCLSYEDKLQYAEEVWKILNDSYKYCGGLKNMYNVEQLIDESDLWKLQRKGGKIVAAIVYTNERGGRKSCFGGTDGTSVGVEALRQMMREDFKLEDREVWVGLSGKALVTALRNGAMPVPADVAIAQMNSHSKKTKCVPIDEYWYQREIEGKMHKKVMVGNPPGYKKVDVPQEVIDRLITQAKEYGTE